MNIPFYELFDAFHPQGEAGALLAQATVRKESVLIDRERRELTLALRFAVPPSASLEREICTGLAECFGLRAVHLSVESPEDTAKTDEKMSFRARAVAFGSPEVYDRK